MAKSLDKTIEKNNKIIPFQSRQIRRSWYNETWFYSLVDIIGALTESANPTLPV